MREGISFLASLAGAVVLTALAILIQPNSPFWKWALWIGIAVFTACTLMFLIDLVRPGGKVLLLIGIGTGVALFVACAIPVLFESSTTTENKWHWNALSSSEIDDLYTQLHDTGGQTISIGCINAECGDLADSFRQLFTRLKWAYSSMQIPPVASGLVGLLVNPDDNFTRKLRDAIESSTSFKVLLGAQGISGSGQPPVLLIGAKPQILSQEEQQQIAEELERLSVEMLEFVADRERERGLLPPIAETGQTGGMLRFQRDSQFSGETETLFERKFGVRATRSMAQLVALGIRPGFQIRTAGGRDAKFGKFFGVMGKLIKEGRIEEAKNNAADEYFWFHQR